MPTDADLVVEIHLFGRRHVEGLTQRDVELVVGPDVADAGGVVVGGFVRRNQLAPLCHHADRHIRIFIEELGGRKCENPVLLHQVHDPVLGHA
jgi:hypothetical protein